MYIFKFLRNILPTILIFLLSGCYSDNQSNLPVRLVIHKDSLSFDGKPLSFSQPVKDWIDVLGDDYLIGKNKSGPRSFVGGRIIYPKLGIDLAIDVQTKANDTERNFSEDGSLKDPMARYVGVVRVMLHSHVELNEYFIGDKTHPFNTMKTSYAIDYFGAIIDADTPKEQILKYANGAEMSSVFNRIDVNYNAVNIDNKASLWINYVDHSDDEILGMMQITGSNSIMKAAREKYINE